MGGAGDDWGYDISKTNDGGFIVAGMTKSKGSGGKDFYVLKLDSSGIMGWEKTFGGANYDEARGIFETADGGFVLAGTTKSKGAGANDYWVVKLDSDGNLEWDRAFGSGSNDYGRSVIQKSNGGFVIGGSVQVTGGKSDFRIFNID